MPKPLLPIHGRPFLDYLLDDIKEAEIRRVVLLTGYLSDQIEAAYGEGSERDMEILHSRSPVEDDTGTRVRNALDMLDDTFLLMYCDNRWPIRLSAMWEHYEATGAEALLTAYSNPDGYTKNNLSIGEDGMVGTYDRTRTQPGLTGVDIGFMILRKSTIAERIPADANAALEATVIRPLVDERRMSGFLTGHRYYSIGSHVRLPITKRHLAREPAVLLDRDGVLNERMPRAQYVRTWDEWRWRPRALEAMRLLADHGFRCFLISNQPGIARGAMTAKDLAAIHGRMVSEIEAAGGRIDGIYVCAHDWDEGCMCRKPAPGMLEAAQREHDLDLSRTFFIGDDERDAQAAHAAGAPWALVNHDQDLLDLVRALVANRLPRSIEQPWLSASS